MYFSYFKYYYCSGVIAAGRQHYVICVCGYRTALCNSETAYVIGVSQIYVILHLVDKVRTFALSNINVKNGLEYMSQGIALYLFLS